MFESDLKKYEINGSFTFSTSELLREKCNAPTNKSGVYLIYKLVNGQEILIYIGSSGRRGTGGTLKTRIGGMKDRIVNGYHPNRFGQIRRIPRHKAFPQQMRVEKLTDLKIYWWVTYEDYHSDYPTDIESKLVDKYRLRFKRLPDWHQQGSTISRQF